MEGKNEEDLQEVIEEENFDYDNSNEDFDMEGESDEGYDGQEDFSFGGSEPDPLGGIYGLFKDTLNRKDSKKVSNISNEELGVWNLSVRDCERIALIAETFKHPGVAKFFREQSRIITDTAMSKKGWFAELFVTSKKYASRESSSSVWNPSQQDKKEKWKIFSNRRTQQNQIVH